MEPNPIVMVIISVICIGGALYLLGEAFKVAIKALKFVGSLIVAGVVAFISVMLSSAIFEISTAQAAVQFVGTQVLLAGIGMGTFANAEDNP